MFTIPSWWLRTHTEAEIEVALDFRLDVKDVAEILHVTPRQVTRWAHDQQLYTLKLKSRQYHGSPARAYRLGDVQVFAGERGLSIDLSGVPRSLRVEWGIDALDKFD